jgi:hypothetical protein
MLSTTATLFNDTSMFDRISVTHPLRPANLPTSFVGQFAWSGFNSFCVEIGQSISPGLHTFPTRAPLASSGLANAGLVADFWRSYGPKTTGFTSVTDAAAFQLGIWELISDGPSRNLKSGSFQVGASASPAVARAESWLNGTGTPAPSAGGPAVSLYVLQHPTRQDQVVWEPLPNITVQVAPPSVAEDGPEKLTYTFTATGPLTRDVTVNYSVGGSATAGSDFTGLPAGASTGAITIPANSGAPGSAATLAITPTPDTVVEFDETVVISLLPGTGYTFDTTRPPATGTIENDDYLVDLDVDSNNDGKIDRSPDEENIEDLPGEGKQLVFGVPSEVTLSPEEPQNTADIIVTASPSSLGNGRQLRITAGGGLNIWLNKEKTQPLGSHNTDPNQPDVFTFDNATFTGEQRLYVDGNVEGIDRAITLALLNASGAIISEDRIFFSVEEYIDIRPIETLARLNTQVGAALAGDALQLLTAAEYNKLKDAGLEVGRHDGLWDYVFVEIGKNYYTYIEPTLPGFSYQLFAIAPNTVAISSLQELAGNANWLVGLGAADVALSIIPGGTSAGYLEEGNNGRAALWFLADVALTLSVVGKLGQVTAKLGSVVKSGTAVRLGNFLHNAAKIGQYRHVALGATIATGILGAESGAGAVSDVLNGKYTAGTIKGIDAVFAALGVASSGVQYREALTKAATANKKLAEKVDVSQLATKTDHAALASTVAGSLDDIVSSSSMRRMSIPNRVVQSTVDDYVAENLRLFEEAGGTINRNAGPAPTRVVDGETYKLLGNMNYSKKLIRLYDGHEIQDVVEELAHFRQAVRDGLWGTTQPLGSRRKIWESQIDVLFDSLGFVPR